MAAQLTSFESARCSMRLIDTHDAPLLLEMYNSDDFINHIGDRKLRTVEAAEQYIKDYMFPVFDAHGFGNYVIRYKDDPNPLGTCGIFFRDELDVPDIGYGLLPAYYKKGLATECANQLIDEVQKVFGITTYSAITSKQNIASKKVLKKLGFNFVKMTKVNDEELCYFELKKA